MKTPIFTLIQAVPALGGQVPDTASFPSGGMPSDGTILAYHEAGHAFMAYFLGRGFTEVSIVPDEKNLGHLTKTPLKKLENWDTQIVSWTLLEREILVYLGGLAAEERLVGIADWEIGGQGDFGEAADMALEITRDGDKEEANALLDWLWIRARKIMRPSEHWAAVQALADQLLERRRLGGGLARKIIKEAMSATKRQWEDLASTFGDQHLEILHSLESGLSNWLGYNSSYYEQRSRHPTEGEPVGRRRRRRQKTILWIEDDRHFLDDCCRAMEDEGFKIEWVTTASEAVQILRSGTFRFDLILLDVILPPGLGDLFPSEMGDEERGLAILNLLQEQGVTDLPPIVLLTARRPEINLEKLRSDFPNFKLLEILGKPLRVKQLIEMVAQHVRTCET